MDALLERQGYLYSFSKTDFKRYREKSMGCQTEISQAKKIITVLIADDHPYLIKGVETDLSNNPRIKYFGSVGTYSDLLEKARALQPDIILLDLKMPGNDIYDFKHYLTGLKSISNNKIIIFTNETGWPRVYKCFEYGASAYIEKAISVGKLPELIIDVYENDDDLLIFTAEQKPDIHLGKKKKEILSHVIDGRENDEIAKILDLELKTVQSYVSLIRTQFSKAFGIHPLSPRAFLFLASKLGYGHKVN